MSDGSRHSGAVDAARTPTRVRVRHRGTDLFLAPGTYLIGRSAGCHIVLDEAMVSRRHAELVVRSGAVTIRDLDSANGVCINGTRIGTGPEPLKDGDRIDVGTEQLELRIEPLERVAAQSEPHREARPTLNAIKIYDSNPPSWEGSTKRSNALELVGLVADKAIAAGRPREAEEMLRVHLTRVLNEVTTKRDVPNDTREAAITLAIKLARATGEGRWFDYVIDVLSAGQQLVSDALSEELRATLAKVGVIDVARLERYQATIKNLPTSFERLRAGQHVEDLLRAAKVRR